jgi:hypothetical protein
MLAIWPGEHVVGKFESSQNLLDTFKPWIEGRVYSRIGELIGHGSVLYRADLGAGRLCVKEARKLVRPTPNDIFGCRQGASGVAPAPGGTPLGGRRVVLKLRLQRGDPSSVAISQTVTLTPTSVALSLSRSALTAPEARLTGGFSQRPR